jgi:hypothetical protein
VNDDDRGKAVIEIGGMLAASAIGLGFTLFYAIGRAAKRKVRDFIRGEQLGDER